MTPKQSLFILEYLKDLNATQAAIRAGYSEKAAEQQAYQLLQKASVSEAIQKAMDERSRKVELTAERVLSEISCMAFYDPAELLQITKPEDIKNLPEPVRRAIIGWSWDKQGNFVLKLSPKTPSLDLLGRHLKLFTDKIEVDVSDRLATRLKEARERVNGQR